MGPQARSRIIIDRSYPCTPNLFGNVFTRFRFSKKLITLSARIKQTFILMFFLQ